MSVRTTEGGTVVSGEGIPLYQAIVVRQGLKACKIGCRLNTAYTPKNLMAMTLRITGRKHKARDYDGAIEALSDWIDRKKAELGSEKQESD